MKHGLIAGLVLVALSGCSQQSTEEYVSAAREASQQQDYNRALIQLKNAAKQSPDNASVRFELGKTLVATGQLEAAEKELLQALEDGYDASEILPLLARLYQQSGVPERIFNLADRAARFRGKALAQYRFYSLQAYVDTGKFKQAREFITALEQQPEAEVYASLAEVYSMLIDQRMVNGLLKLDDILATYPNDADALKLQAKLYLNIGQQDLAADTFNRYVENYPDDIGVKMALTRLYMDGKKYDLAEPILDQLLVNFPNRIQLIRYKAIARAEQQAFTDALAYAEQALKINGEDPLTRLIAGVSAYQVGDTQKSYDNLVFVADLLPSDHPALHLYAYLQLQLGFINEAFATVQKFSEISEQDTVIMAELGRALLAKGEVNKARILMAKQPETVTHPQAIASLAKFKLSFNDVSGALALASELEQSASSDSEQMESILAQTFVSAKEFDKAMEIARRWQQSDDSTTQVRGYSLAAIIKVQQNERASAREYYEQALALDPENVDIQLALITLDGISSKVQAEEQLDAINQLLAEHPAFVPAILRHYILSKQLNQPSTMIQHLEKLANDERENPTYSIALGKIYMLENEPKQALTYLEKVKTDTADAFWEVLAQAYQSLGMNEKLFALYREWYAQQPTQQNAVLGMMNVHIAEQEYAEALAVSEDYLNKIGGFNTQVLFTRLQLLARLGELHKLDGELAKLPEQVQALPFVRGLRGQVELANGKYQMAQDNLLAAYEALPSTVNTAFLLNAIFRNEGQDKAINFLKQHITQYPDDEGSVMRYAQLIEPRDKQEANKYYLKVLDLNPDNFVAHNNLANMLLADNALEAAYQHAKKALDINGEHPQVLDTVGHIALLLKDNEAALLHLKKAVRLMGDGVSDEVVLHYAEALFRNAQLEEAGQLLDAHSFKTSTTTETAERLRRQFL